MSLRASSSANLHRCKSIITLDDWCPAFWKVCFMVFFLLAMRRFHFPYDPRHFHVRGTHSFGLDRRDKSYVITCFKKYLYCRIFMVLQVNSILRLFSSSHTKHSITLWAIIISQSENLRKTFVISTYTKYLLTSRKMIFRCLQYNILKRNGPLLKACLRLLLHF